MTRKVEYIECDCGQGKLVEIASTNAVGGYAEKDDDDPGGFYPVEYTIFYECDHCQKIYQDDRDEDPWGGKTGMGMTVTHRGGTTQTFDLDQESFLKPYDGKLSRDQIVNHSQDIGGPMDAYHEGCIIAAENGTIDDFMRNWKDRIVLEYDPQRARDVLKWKP